MRPHTTDDTDTIEHKLFYSLSKPVPNPGNGNSEHSSIACRSYSVSFGALESSDMLNTNLMTSSTFKLRDYSPLLDLASSSKQENSGQKLVIVLYAYYNALQTQDIYCPFCY